MQNNYNYRFKHFDPKEGILPEPYAVLFVELNYRARNILESFTSNDINLGIQAINKFTREEDFVDPLWEDLKKTPIKTPMYGQIYDVIPSTNDIEAIFNNMANISLSEFTEVPNFDWTHLFASITLYHSELILDLLHSQSSWKSTNIFPRPTNETINNFVSEFIVDAKQSIVYAENLLREKQILSSNASKAAKQRFAKTSDPLRDLVIKTYLENKYQNRTNRGAALKIFELLQDLELIFFDSIKNKTFLDNNLALSTDDPPHQFEKWISAHKKNLS